MTREELNILNDIIKVLDRLAEKVDAMNGYSAGMRSIESDISDIRSQLFQLQYEKED